MRSTFAPLAGENATIESIAAAFVAPVAARLAAVARPEPSIVVTRLLTAVTLEDVATPEPSMVVIRLLYPTPDDAKLTTDPVKATPEPSIVVTRPPTVTILAAFVAPVDARLAAVATPVDCMVVIKAPLLAEKGVIASIAAAFVAPVDARLAVVASPEPSMVDILFSADVRSDSNATPEPSIVETLLLTDVTLAEVATPEPSMAVTLFPTDVIFVEFVEAAAALVAPVDARLAVVASPELSIVDILDWADVIAAAFVVPVDAKLEDVATPVDCIVVINAPLVALKETADVVCTVPSLKESPLAPSFTPVIEAIFPVVKTELSAG